MNRVHITLVITFFAHLATAQYSWDVKIDNVRQIDESTLQWEVWIRKGEGSLDFAFYGGQFTFQFNQELKNGGAFESAYLTIEGGQDMNQHPGFYRNADFVASGKSLNRYFNYASAVTPNTSEGQTIISGTWLQFAVFQAQLRKDGSPHPFADVDPRLAFHAENSQIVIRDQVTQDTYSGSNVNIPTTSATFFPARGVAANDRQLAGFCFSGEGDWADKANWNIFSTGGTGLDPGDMLPGISNNVLIDGHATVSGELQVVNELTVREQALLVIADDGQLTTESLYNDNNNFIDRSGNTTIVEWNFNDQDDDFLSPPYTPDLAVDININAVLVTSNGVTDHEVHNEAIHANKFYKGPSGPVPAQYRSWVIQFSTSGYQHLTLSSKQWTDKGGWGSLGPTSWLVEISHDETNWTEIASVTTLEDWTTGVIDQLHLPPAFEDQNTVYIRWRNTDEKEGYTGIDEIMIMAEEIPPPPTGILIESTAEGTGSLILNNAGVSASVQQYIPKSTDWDAQKSHAASSWYWISSPVSGQGIASFLSVLEDSGSDFDLYRWGEADDLWYNYKAGSGVPDNLFAHENFQRGTGYLFAAQTTTTYTFDGVLHVDNQEWNELSRAGLGNEQVGIEHPTYYQPGWNLISNPYASAIMVGNGYWSSPGGVNLVPQYYNNTFGSYLPYTEGSSIPPMTAFFVQANNAKTPMSMNISKDARVHQNYSEKSNNSYITLAVKPVADETKQYTYLHVVPDALDNLDYRYDSRFRPGKAPIFFSKKNQENLLVHAINHIHDELSIPLVFHQNEQGNTFDISLEENIPNNLLYLYDKKKKQSHELSSQAPYTFEACQDDDPLRFELRFSPISCNLTDLENDDAGKTATAWISDHTLYIRSYRKNVKVSLFDINRREIRQYFLPEEGQHTYPLNLPYGIYYLDVVSHKQAKTIKLIVQ